jgi:hypothetical protein
VHGGPPTREQLPARREFLRSSYSRWQVHPASDHEPPSSINLRWGSPRSPPATPQRNVRFGCSPRRAVHTRCGAPMHPHRPTHAHSHTRTHRTAQHWELAGGASKQSFFKLRCRDVDARSYTTLHTQMRTIHLIAPKRLSALCRNVHARLSLRSPLRPRSHQCSMKSICRLVHGPCSHRSHTDAAETARRSHHDRSVHWSWRSDSRLGPYGLVGPTVPPTVPNGLIGLRCATAWKQVGDAEGRPSTPRLCPDGTAATASLARRALLAREQRGH